MVDLFYVISFTRISADDYSIIILFLTSHRQWPIVSESECQHSLNGWGVMMSFRLTIQYAEALFRFSILESC